MLLIITNDTVTSDCICGGVTTHELSELTSSFLEEFNEYSNINLNCDYCGVIQAVNMNLTDEEDCHATDFPPAELKSRYIARELQNRMINNKSLLIQKQQ